VNGGDAFIELRDRLLREGLSHSQALQSFHWPPISHFNWARDYFDRIAAGNDRPALRVIGDTGTDFALSFAALAQRSNQVANFLASLGIGPGDRVLMMLGNVIPLWETMLAVIKLGAVMIPATTLLQRAELEDRLVRGCVRAVRQSPIEFIDAATRSRRTFGLRGASGNKGLERVAPVELAARLREQVNARCVAARHEQDIAIDVLPLRG